ncbi:hypothetical protein BREU_2317 [Bifidobacterium reuteri DSM 23975]|uniref:Uncharacterized protein n=1 Tax=Bifidobacterium reuteri DSM 23975 TaxID=1437610 RepID=A0A087CJZ3_9BIFI|nr:hypothetical protein BREU_2317 [Bifidobacterium reuteri DSM 23975]
MLGLAPRYLLTGEYRICLVECQVLIDAYGCIERRDVVISNHLSNAFFAGGYGGNPVADEHSGWAHALSREIVRALDAAKYGDMDDVAHNAGVVLHRFAFDGGIRGQIRSDGIADHVADAAHHGIGVIHADGDAVIVDADVQVTAFGVRESDNLSFRRIVELSFEFDRGAFMQSAHGGTPVNPQSSSMNSS